MKLIFMGTPEFAVPTLQKLAEAGHSILAVVTQPDRPVGRKQRITSPPVKTCAQSLGISVLQPLKIKTAETRAQLEPLIAGADAIVVAAYGRILPEWMLNTPRFGAINVHSSLLPKYRGAAPINWAIANGEHKTGVTIMQMDAGLDTGAILLQCGTKIGEEETATELSARLATVGAELLIEALSKIERDDISPTPQDSGQASYAPLLTREDGRINWNLSAPEIFNRLRGFNPFPGCHTYLNLRRLEIVRASPELGPLVCPSPGTIVELTRDSFVVQCGNASRLRVFEVQPEGRSSMSVLDFLNGARIEIGVRLGQLT